MVATRSITRAGMTQIELLVVIAITSLLLALLLPAVQQSRMVSLRARCQNNCHQIGVAVHNHVEIHGSFPRPDGLFLREILPHLGEQAVWEEIQDHRFPDREMHAFECPADTWATGNRWSYFLNKGTRVFSGRVNLNGFDVGVESRDLKPADVTDGLSQTVGLSERALAESTVLMSAPTNTPARDSRRYLWFTRNGFANPGEEPLAVAECRNHRTTTEPAVYIVGVSGWLTHSYDHLLPPNHPGCANTDAPKPTKAIEFLVPSSSMHTGGANSLLLDGSARFVNEHVDATVWQSLGTRNGNEVVPTW